jgi:pimeloyl-ACP methyl ester carboxylesterase
MVNELDLKLGDGRILHIYNRGVDEGRGRLPVFWHHGMPNIGSPPAPLFPAAERLGLRWVSYDRPGRSSRSRRRPLVLHGGRDRVVPSAHAEWLADRCPTAQLRLCPDEGHISILGSSESALAWLRATVD